MKWKPPRLCSVFLLAALLPACRVMDAPRRPAAAEDAGPKPQHPAQIIADWANARYKFVPSAPFTAQELALSDPKPISCEVIFSGHKVGWQVISGPENRRLQYDAIEMNYTRFIIHHDRVISVVGLNHPFPDPQ